MALQTASSNLELGRHLLSLNGVSVEHASKFQRVHFKAEAAGSAMKIYMVDLKWPKRIGCLNYEESCWGV